MASLIVTLTGAGTFVVSCRCGRIKEPDENAEKTAIVVFCSS